MFGAPAVMAAEIDSEAENQDYFAVRVATHAPVAAIVRLNDFWHRKLLQVAGESAHQFRLALEIT